MQNFTHIVIIFLIIVSLLTLGCSIVAIIHNLRSPSEVSITNNDIIVKPSLVAGRGVFAKRDFLPGELIEVCPLIRDQSDKFTGVVNDYTFSDGTKDNGTKYSVLPFGYCALVNHSSDPNAEWRIHQDMMYMHALKKIPAGDEIFHNYQDTYWTTRKQKLGYNNISSGFN